MPEQDNTQSALNAGMLLAQIRSITPDGKSAPLGIVPPNSNIHTPNYDAVEKWLSQPLRKKGNFQFGDLESLTAYFKQHQTEDSRVFVAVNEHGGVVRAVLNFHGAQPSFNDHIASYALNFTPEWNKWVANQWEHEFPQADFAEFLEDNASFFLTPSGADLLELVQNLEGHHNATIRSAVKLKTGQVKVSYDEEIELRGTTTTQSGDLEIPSTLTVAIAPFEGLIPYTMTARLRYRIRERKIMFSYKPNNVRDVLRLVANDILKAVSNMTGVTPFRLP